MEMWDHVTSVLKVWWEYIVPILIKMISGSLALEGAICLWRRERYSWRRALAIFLIIDTAPYLFRRIAGAITTGILETFRLWGS